MSDTLPPLPMGRPPVNRERAREYILAHPDESKLQQAIGAQVSEATIARTRTRLVREGLLPVSRKAVTGLTPESPVAPVRQTAAPTKPPEGALDNAAMRDLASMLDELTDEEDDAIVQRRLIKQCLTFAFNPNLHPDTRMSASQMWEKLRTRAQQRVLGPGKPKTLADAVARLRDLMVAVGAEVTLAAVNEAFEAKEPSDERNVPANASEVAPGDAGATSAP